MNLIDKLREDQPAMSQAALGVRSKAADAIEELIGVLLRWQAAWDWADETVLVNASPTLLTAAEETDRVLRGYGVREASSSVNLKKHRRSDDFAGDGCGVADLDASGRNTAVLTRAGLKASDSLFD